MQRSQIRIVWDRVVKDKRARTVTITSNRETDTLENVAARLNWVDVLRKFIGRIGTLDGISKT